MKDVGGNIRYYGASPNNYIFFNCSDYSNQSSSTCETWRIIGVFDGKLKLIRNKSIGGYSWDNKGTTTGAETGFGKNDWTDARLMKLLNPGYESETTGGSLYYNAKSGNCYAGINNTTTTCNFTSSGIKNATTRNMISDNNYSLLGWNSSKVYSDQIYEYERTAGKVLAGRPTSWTGKIALPYPSDYGYAADLDKCTKQLDSYNDTTCISNNWMKTIVSNDGSKYGWFLIPYTDFPMGVWYAHPNGIIMPTGNPQSQYIAFGTLEVAPVLYLKSDLNLSLGSGTGTSTAPYQLSI